MLAADYLSSLKCVRTYTFAILILFEKPLHKILLASLSTSRHLNETCKLYDTLALIFNSLVTYKSLPPAISCHYSSSCLIHTLLIWSARSTTVIEVSQTPPIAVLIHQLKMESISYSPLCWLRILLVSYNGFQLYRTGGCKGNVVNTAFCHSSYSGHFFLFLGISIENCYLQ
jgi:hypothetical protein